MGRVLGGAGERGPPRPDQPLSHRLRAARRRRRAAHVVEPMGEHPCADRVPHHLSNPSRQTFELIVISEPPSHGDRLPAAATKVKDTSAYEKLKSLAITLPGVTPPVAAFVPFLRSGNLIYVSGHIAKKEDRPWTGQLGADITTADGKEAARGIAIDLLGVLEAATGNLDSIRRIVKLLVLVNSAPTFKEQHLVANGASELLAEVFGERGQHARSAFGAAQIPFGSCVEVELVAEVADAQSQPAGLQAAFARDAGTLSNKFTGLARVLSGKYDWKPAQGVRSVADVFNLIVKENGLLAGVLSGTPNTGASPAPITDPEKMQEALKASYLNLQKAIAALSDNDLQAPVKLFGRDMTKQDALMLIFEDQHEHLGQSIAYARSNGVVPPWSK